MGGKGSLTPMEIDEADELEQLRARNEWLGFRIEAVSYCRRQWGGSRYVRYGWMRNPNRPGVLVANLLEQDIARLIVRLHGEGTSATEITRDLNRRGLPHRSAKFCRSLIQNVIKRAAAGEYPPPDSS